MYLFNLDQVVLSFYKDKYLDYPVWAYSPKDLVEEMAGSLQFLVAEERLPQVTASVKKLTDYGLLDCVTKNPHYRYRPAAMNPDVFC